MPYYISLVDRRVASTKGPCFTFESMIPIFIHPQDATIPDIEAAGCLPADVLAEVLTRIPDLSQYLDADAAPDIVYPEDPPTLDYAEDGDLEGEMRALRYAEEEQQKAYREAVAIEEAEEDAKAAEAKAEEKSPVFDQVVFEAAVHGILDSGDVALLTPKGFPKASAIKDLTGFDVTPIKVVRFCKSLKE